MIRQKTHYAVRKVRQGRIYPACGVPSRGKRICYLTLSTCRRCRNTRAFKRPLPI